MPNRSFKHFNTPTLFIPGLNPRAARHFFQYPTWTRPILKKPTRCALLITLFVNSKSSIYWHWKLLTSLVVTVHGESQPSTSWRLGGWGRKSWVGLRRISHRWETHRGAKGAGKALKHWSRLEVLLVDFLCPRKQCLVLGSNENKLWLLKIWPKSNCIT